jgi:hypothetical protein
MPGDAASAVGFRARRELMHGLAERLTAAGLSVRTLTYKENAVDLADRIEEIEVTNHALPGRGTFRVCEDGVVRWEYWGSFRQRPRRGRRAARQIRAPLRGALAPGRPFPSHAPFDASVRR